MIRPETYENIISGERGGLIAGCARGLLAGLEPIYRSGVAARNLAYSRNWKKSHRVALPVLSVGNLTVGGTGKTPLTSWLVRSLEATGYRPAIISRGYGSQSGQPNDEYRELRWRCPETEHVQNPDRVAAARQLADAGGWDALILDDGFQHRRLHRNLDIVLIDCTRPFGFGHLLPRGMLREPLSSLQRADAVILTRVDQVDAGHLANVETCIRRYNSQIPLAHCCLEISRVSRTSGESFPISDWLGELRGQTTRAFCGIGNPDAFARSLHKLLGHPVPLTPFPDHHDYSVEDLGRLVADHPEVDTWICTVKDLVKLQQLDLPGWAERLVALWIDARLRTGEAAIMQTVQNAMRPQRS